jgi:hypothetical protein
MPLACRVFGHRPRFWAEGSTLHWQCDRDCDDAGGTRAYKSADDARRIAAALDVEDREGIGNRPIMSLMPLKLAKRSR